MKPAAVVLLLFGVAYFLVVLPPSLPPLSGSLFPTTPIPVTLCALHARMPLVCVHGHPLVCGKRLISCAVSACNTTGSLSQAVLPYKGVKSGAHHISWSCEQ